MLGSSVRQRGVFLRVCSEPHPPAICNELLQLISLLPIILSASQESESIPDSADAFGPGSGIVLTGALAVVSLRRVQVPHPVVVSHERLPVAVPAPQKQIGVRMNH